MMVLVIGPNGSGKSAYAERLASCLCTGKLYYVATLLPFGKEGAARIEKHRVQRSGMGFVTVESPYALLEASGQDTVLLEDASNLVANLMFEKRDCGAVDTALDRIIHLGNDCGNLICVSITSLAAVPGGDEETNKYIAALKRVNEALFAHADAVVELNSGIPRLRKGSLPCVS